MSPQEYLRARAKIEQDARHKIRALDEVWAIINDGTPLPQPINGHDDAVLAVRGAWRIVAQQVIDDLPSGDQFVVNDIESGIAAKNPLIATDKISISIFLKKKADENKIRIVEPGAGRRATIYAKK